MISLTHSIYIDFCLINFGQTVYIDKKDIDLFHERFNIIVFEPYCYDLLIFVKIIEQVCHIVTPRSYSFNTLFIMKLLFGDIF